MSVRVALLGAGFIGAVHARNLAAHPAVEFVGVYDVDAERAAQVADVSGVGVIGIDAALDPAVADAVLIASSTDTHADLLGRAASAGLAVLCEKPIDLDLARAIDTVERAEATGCVAMVDFNRRFDADYAALHAAVTAGDIGEVEFVQMTTRGPVVPPISYLAVSGGQMRDQTVHFFDLARWITGMDPVSVFASGSVVTDPRVADVGDLDLSLVTLRMPTGALVSIDSARRTAYGYDERIEVMGSAGLIEAGRQQTGSITRFGAGHAIVDGLHPGWFERVADTYGRALDHFVSAVSSGEDIGPTLSEALKAQAIAEAATRSLTSGRLETIHYPVGSVPVG